MEITGLTYSTEHYNHYEKNGDKNYFEEIVDKMILEGISGMNDSFREAIKALPKDKKRMTILSLLDKDLNLFTKIKSFVSGEKLSKVDHLKDVILMLRDYVKVGEVEKKKFGEVMTDLELVKHILSRIPEEDFKNPNKTFIDFANGTGVFPLVVIYRLMKGLKDVEGFENDEVRYKHIIENQIFVSEIQPKNMFLYMCLVDPHDEYKLNIYTGSSLDEGFKNHMKNVWCKESFDYGIGNPPFNQMIDMKFVRLSYELCDVTCIVHPSTWLLDEKGKQKAFTETKDLIKDHLESIELFNGNKIFNIALFVPCVITYINKNKSSVGIECLDKINDIQLVYDNIYQINKYSDKFIYISLKDKIKNIKIDNLWNKYKNDNKLKDYMISFTGIRGNVNLKTDDSMVQKDFYTIVSVERKPQISTEVVGDSFLKFYFKNELECNNFLNYLKTNFVRFLLSIYKNNQNLHRGELSIIPWLDFTQEWTDEKLYIEFNLTEEEIKFIEKNIPKYY
jgi:hypothetical protein